MAERTDRERPTILVIDDDVGPRESLRFLLCAEYEVLCADSVDAGLRLHRENDVVLIITDIRMPGQDGLEGLKRIRGINAEVPIIVLTVLDTPEMRETAMSRGATSYMTKPFDGPEMCEAVRRHIAGAA